jgi:hypothetical protein
MMNTYVDPMAATSRFGNSVQNGKQTRKSRMRWKRSVGIEVVSQIARHPNQIAVASICKVADWREAEMLRISKIEFTAPSYPRLLSDSLPAKTFNMPDRRPQIQLCIAKSLRDRPSRFSDVGLMAQHGQADGIDLRRSMSFDRG